MTEFVKMGRAFKCRLPPSNASVTQDSLVSSSYSTGRAEIKRNDVVTTVLK